MTCGDALSSTEDQVRPPDTRRARATATQWRRLACLAVRILLAAILLAAAALKGIGLRMGKTDIGFGGIASGPLIVVLIQFEIALCIWLLSGLYARGAWRVSLSCFALFACISLYKGLMGEADCGCFGPIKVNPWLTAVMDLAAVLGLLVTWPARVGPVMPHRWPQVLATASSVILLSAAGAYGATVSVPDYLAASGMGLGHGHFVLLEPETWKGQRLPILEHIDIGKQLSKGKWIVLMHQHTCPDCPEAVAYFRRLAGQTAGQKDAPRVALVEIPPYESATPPVEAGAPYWATGRLSDAREWFVTTPVILSLIDGRVVKVSQGKQNQRESYD